MATRRGRRTAGSAHDRREQAEAGVGRPYPLGVDLERGGANFSVFSRDADSVDLLLYDDVDDAAPDRVIPLDRSRHRTYHYWHTHVPGIRSGQIYAYRARGPFEPRRGFRFDETKVLVDPYGRAVAVPAEYHRWAGTGPGSGDAHAFKSIVADVEAYDWEGDRPLHRPFSELSWFDWDDLDRHADLKRFVQRLIEIRFLRESVTVEHDLTLESLTRRADVRLHGVRLGRPDYGPDSHSLAATAQSLSGDLLMHFALNAWTEPLEFELPQLPGPPDPPASTTGTGSDSSAAVAARDGWRRVVDSAQPPPWDIVEPAQAPVVHGRTVTVEPARSWFSSPQSLLRRLTRPPKRSTHRVKTTEEAMVELIVVPLDKPEDMNVIVGQAHFIKTVEDIHEALAGSSPHLRFGLAFCEASGPCLVRRSGNDDRLVELATRNAVAVGAGHSFYVFVEGGFPVNVLNALKQVPEVCGIFCATANPVEIIVAETELGRGIAGVIDGRPPAGVESDTDVAARKALLRSIGYKL